jgi:hypothetical protein
MNESLIPLDGEVVEIRRRKQEQEKLPPYNLVGNGYTNQVAQSRDILDTCAQLNLAENRLLQFFRNEFTIQCIRKEACPNIIVPTASETFTDYLKNALRKNYLHMEDERVIVRIGRGKYMLSTLLFMYPAKYAETLLRWTTLVDKIVPKDDA